MQRLSFAVPHDLDTRVDFALVSVAVEQSKRVARHVGRAQCISECRAEWGYVFRMNGPRDEIFRRQLRRHAMREGAAGIEADDVRSQFPMPQTNASDVSSDVERVTVRGAPRRRNGGVCKSGSGKQSRLVVTVPAPFPKSAARDHNPEGASR